jgi:hypothetical protein
MASASGKCFLERIFFHSIGVIESDGTQSLGGKLLYRFAY